jgi:hypothetical protein
MSHALLLVALEGVQNNEKVVEEAVASQMEPFNENEEMFRTGSRWDWYQIGGRYKERLLGKDVARKGDLSIEALKQDRRRRFTETYKEAEKEKSFSKLLYGVDPSKTTLEEWLNKNVDSSSPLTAYAFLRSRHWNEGERLGWFGCSTATECELAGANTKKCVTKDPRSEARIVTWNESEEEWDRQFYHRFIENLPDESLLVVVDYHV